MREENLYGYDIRNRWWFSTLIDLDENSFIQIDLRQKGISEVEDIIEVDVHDYSY